MNRMTEKELLSICEALNILFWKLPAITKNENDSGHWWAAELQDKDIPIIWDETNEEFSPRRDI